MKRYSDETRADYEIDQIRDRQAEFRNDIAHAKILLAGADGLSFDAQCHMLVDDGMNWKRAVQVLRKIEETKS